ncbi:MAG TPA: RNA-binding protein [Pyrinomonadaceae bacterium]|jgi:RNA recognition motif-containing protein|nr:RNA-binding protein [Pyrinomonadaceae bacterium]
MKIYIGNLSFSTNTGELEELFSGYGTVESATIVEDRDTGRSRGFGFVEMPSNEEAQRAIGALDGSEFGGRQIKVNEARPREDRGFQNNHRGGRGGGNRRDFGGSRNRW